MKLTIITKKDVLEEAKKQLGVELTDIIIGADITQLKEENMSIEEKSKVHDEYLKVLMGYCPFCNNYYSSSIGSYYKKSVTLNLPTYSVKNINRYYNFRTQMCPLCFKDFITISFKDDRFSYENDNFINNGSYIKCIAFDKNATKYNEEELKELPNWEDIQRVRKEFKK